MAIGISVSFRDEAGKEGSTSFNVPDATSLSNAGLAAKAWALLADEISDAQIIGLSITYPVALPAGLKSAPVDGARVGVGALFQFRTALNHITKFILPARKESIILDTTDAVDTSDTDVANLIAAMTAGIDLEAVSGTGTVAPVDTRGEDVASLEDAYETIGGKRRR
jgi:hypothetical protein